MKEVKGETDFYFGFQFIRSLAKIFPYLYTGFDEALLYTGILFAMAGSYEYVNYYTGTMIGDFYEDLLAKNESAFWKLFAKGSGLYLAQTLLLAAEVLVSCILGIAFRKTLVTSLHRIYFKDRTYYRLNAINNEGIDNPDQRITQDVEKLTRILAKNVLPYLIISPGVVIYYSYKTWTQATWIGVACIYAYFIFGAIVNRILISPFTKWIARVEKSEGDFRYKHVFIRDHAEEAAFYDAEQFEEFEINRSFATLMKNVLRLALWNFPAQFFQYFFDYYGAILTYAIQVIPIFVLNLYKDYPYTQLAGQISNNSFFFMYLINSFTRLTDLAISLGQVAGYSQRVTQILDYGDCSAYSRNDTVVDDYKNDEGDDCLFEAKNLTCSPPGNAGHLLVRDMNKKFPLKNSVLITGSSGVGKTSLLRILKQLWTPSEGQVVRYVSFKNMLFLPQNCYLPVGGLSLKQQLQFPHLHGELDNTDIIRVLESLRLSRLPVLCGDIDDPVDFEWQDVLSPGEQQLLSIARALLQKPKVVILDEATSALPVEMERTVYQLLEKNGINFLSVGHRDSLREFHHLELHIKNSDTWELKDIDHDEKI